MARRVQMLNNLNFIQALKLRFFNKKVVSSHNQILTKLGFVKSTNKDYKIRSWAKFNSDSLDGMQFIAALTHETNIKQCASCTFRVYAISIDDNWTETLLTTLSGTQLPDGRFKASISEAGLNPVELTGEVSFRIEVDLVRQTKTFKDYFYLNHIGIFGEVFVLKKNVTFLELTKLDE
jgi:hypothetical protein